MQKMSRQSKGLSFNRLLKVSGVLLKEYQSFKKFLDLSESEKINSTIPDSFVKTLIQLGPTFIKLGQIISTRPDFIPEEYIHALKVLHDHVPPFTYEEVKRMIEAEFNKDIDRIFRSFDKQPIGAASLSQVHFAVLHDGSQVAVKIQRPHVQKIIQKDLIVLSKLLYVISKVSPKLGRNLNILNAFEQFKAYTMKELDFSLEAKILERFRENFKDWKDVVFPEVYWDYTTSKVLTMQRVSGFRLGEVKSNISAESRKKINKRLIEVEMKMFVTDAFFHADLHPGNIFFRDDGSIAIIDVGMFGELSNEQRDRFLLYWLAVVEKEKIRAFSHLIKMAQKSDSSNEYGFYQRFSEVLDAFYQSDISTRSLTKTYLDIFITGAKFGYIFPGELLLQAKALTTAEALAFTLVPDFQFAQEARPIINRELGHRAEPDEIHRRFKQTFPEWLLLGELPATSIVHSDEEKNKSDNAWVEISKIFAQDLDKRREKENEVRHGEFAVEINESLEKVFNFVTRFAQYPNWHPTYTPNSRVIHVSAKNVFLTPEVVGSVFRLDEIVDGNLLLSNGEIIEFERNKCYKWRAPLSIFLLVDIGTCFTFTDLGNNRTRVHEYFYYIDDPLINFLTYRRWFSKQALVEHIKEELTGVKHIIESKQYNSEDVEYLWENVTEMIRLLTIDDLNEPIKASRPSDFNG
ncbi:AarF/UbiB family protein [Petroclostridium sp. X23]|uniref:AarF/UbiB family protein n=1 Tax=Petroclostridium sp. X23 TaxID=3045146 RepID=UPI0024ADDFF7|nr:AarF/UbiB family protein [Petroclostridium sp. X23]WHH59988.1 AarF/UbiB family protein [Petroclostridium sp. X23]